MRKGGRRELTHPGRVGLRRPGLPAYNIGPNECLRFIIDL